MEVDMSNRNCYNCGGFRHLSRNCNNKRMDRTEDRRRIDIGNGQNNLNRERDLIVFN